MLQYTTALFHIIKNEETTGFWNWKLQTPLFRPSIKGDIFKGIQPPVLEVKDRFFSGYSMHQMPYTFSAFSIVLHFLWFKYGGFHLSGNPNCSLVISSNNFYAYFAHLAPPLEAVLSALSQLDHPQKKCAKWHAIIPHLHFRHLAPGSTSTD